MGHSALSSIFYVYEWRKKRKKAKEKKKIRIIALIFKEGGEGGGYRPNYNKMIVRVFRG